MFQLLQKLSRMIRLEFYSSESHQIRLPEPLMKCNVTVNLEFTPGNTGNKREHDIAGDSRSMDGLIKNKQLASQSQMTVVS